MNNSTGWIALHRKMCINKLWLSEPFTKSQAWIDLLLNANHKAGSFWIRGIEVHIDRGQIGWSELTMAARWRWSKGKVRRFLKWLEDERQIEQQKSQYLTTIITFIHYEHYQKIQQTEQQTEQQKDSRQYSRRYINNNDNNDNNDNNNPLGKKILKIDARRL